MFFKLTDDVKAIIWIELFPDKCITLSLFDKVPQNLIWKNATLENY